MDDKPRARSLALVLLRRSEHVLFAVLLVVGCVRGLSDGAVPPVVLLASAVVFAAWYVAGAVGAGHGAGRGFALVWLAVLASGWVALAELSPGFVWLAFVLFLLAMQMLPPWGGPVAVACLTAAAIALSVRHEGAWNLPVVLGPSIGALVAVFVVIVYRDLNTQVEERTRLLEELSTAERAAGVLAERQRLADEIHDTVTQSLSSVVLLMRSSRRFWGRVPEEARSLLETAESAARSALEDSRRLLRDLEPGGSGPLTTALSRSVEEARALGVEADLTVAGEIGRLPTAVEVALLRACQEALSNVRAHAGATSVAVTLSRKSDSVVLNIADDGRGFDPDDPVSDTTGTGRGLEAMRRRLAEVGGRLEIDSSDAGSSLTASVPATEGSE